MREVQKNLSVKIKAADGATVLGLRFAASRYRIRRSREMRSNTRQYMCSTIAGHPGRSVGTFKAILTPRLWVGS